MKHRVLDLAAVGLVGAAAAAYVAALYAITP
jgi:hypothetical protein